MDKKIVIEKILATSRHSRESGNLPDNKIGRAFAPTNIALCKYWGKRNQELNLPTTSSLSITLGDKGTFTQISLQRKPLNRIWLNGNRVYTKTEFARRLNDFLALFPTPDGYSYKIITTTNIPVAAGLASSASGFAALVKALNNLYNWQLTQTELSILARLGSGSACRSFWPGFVEWEKGTQENGMDSHGKPIKQIWSELRIGLLIINSTQKPISSREGMQRTVATSPYYQQWPEIAEENLVKIKTSIQKQNFTLLGKTAESNSQIMHSIMHSAKPPVIYGNQETQEKISKILMLRKNKLPVYFTQDAGPNLKLLFLVSNTAKVLANFPNLEIIAPFSNPDEEQVILVDENDRSIGTAEKLAAHRDGQLHRAFSIFITKKEKGQKKVLLQRRNKDKYHCGGLWSNTCCSHPRPGEDIITAGKRRLQEEMGFDADIWPQGSFHYRAEFDNGLIEHELDHVLLGKMPEDTEIKINPEEVEFYKWLNINTLKKDLVKNPAKYTPWLKPALQIIKA